MTRRVASVSLAVLVQATMAQMPAELAALVARSKLDRPAAWCHAEFQAGRPGAFAVAVKSPLGDGRYVALEPDATVVTLAVFTKDADLSCYTRAQAIALDATIRRSEAIHGQVTPRWNTTVVCGFTDGTTAVCWQYSPTERAFVEVGGWET